MKLHEKQILKFWDWFAENEPLIKDCIENDIGTDKEFVNDQLNEFILNIGVFTWEIGMNDEGSWFLTISPNGNKNLLKLSRKIMREAPKETEWIFHAGKPAKSWDRIIRINDNNLDQTHIDASGWFFFASTTPAGLIALIIEAGNIQYLDDETAISAADYFVTNELSEEKRIELFAPVKIVSELEQQYIEEKQPVSNFKNYIDALLI